MKSRKFASFQASKPDPAERTDLAVERVDWNEQDGHICVCGATAITEDGFDDTFISCDEVGRPVCTHKELWERPLFRCIECGRIVNLQTFEVIGRGPIGYGW